VRGRDGEFCSPEHRRRHEAGIAPAPPAAFVKDVLEARAEVPDAGSLPCAARGAVWQPGPWGLRIAPLAHRGFRTSSLMRPASPYPAGRDWLAGPELRSPAADSRLAVEFLNSSWAVRARAKRGLAGIRKCGPDVLERPVSIAATPLRAIAPGKHEPILPREDSTPWRSATSIILFSIRQKPSGSASASHSWISLS
jgi:hypothetical protein